MTEMTACPICHAIPPCEHMRERELAADYSRITPRRTPVASPKAVRVKPKPKKP